MDGTVNSCYPRANDDLVGIYEMVRESSGRVKPCLLINIAHPYFSELLARQRMVIYWQFRLGGTALAQQLPTKLT